jgi:two-component system, chemotaxis family, sensor kinase CheA
MNKAATGDDLIAELLPAFIEEAREQIAAFEHLLLELEDAPRDPDLLDALFRCAHTIKGSAGVFGIDRVVEFTHHVEGLLDRLREGQLALTPAMSTLLLECNDAIRELVATVHEPDPEAAVQTRAALVGRLQAVSAQGTQPDVPSAPSAAEPQAAEGRTLRWKLQTRFAADTFRHGMDPLSILRYLAGMGRIESLMCDRSAVPPLEALDPEGCQLAFSFDLVTSAPQERIEQAFSFVQEDCELQLHAEVDADASPSGALREQAPTPAGLPDASGATPRARETSASTASDDGGYIRVHSHRLDEVINLLGELVIAGAGASQLARETRQRGLIEANQQITRLIEGIRNSTLKLRMVPIGDTFSRFRRVVRDTASALGKDVALEIVGGETELDKAMVERIADPLMHLVRNGLDHGLETPEQRLAAGKPAQGRLTLSACHESGSVLIRIVDDGRGIQREKVLQRARERGLVERGVTPNDADILKLIFEPGFSTAEQVTNLSGRGVGMDVVRSNIEALRGSVAIESVEGQGSCIEIRLPLTLAIIDGFLVGVGDSRFIFPLDAVVEVIASRGHAVALDAGGRGCVDLRGGLLPVIDLRTLYALESSPPATASIVVARIGTRRFGVMVDTLLGQHQTVIKPLSRLLRSLRGISGSSILGSGEVALIFDVDALGRLAAGPVAANSTSRNTGNAHRASTDLTLEGDRS